MLSSLIRKSSVVHIGGREFKIRFSLNALLYLEVEYKSIEKILQTEYDKWQIEDCLQLLRAGFCDLPENRECVSNRDFTAVKPLLSELGAAVGICDLPRIRLELMMAISDSFSKSRAAAGNDEEHNYYTGYGHLRAFYCDIIKRPEEEFWSSTRAEIDDRIDKYLEVKGHKEKPVIVKRYDSL